MSNTTNEELVNEQRKICEKYESPVFLCAKELKAGVAMKTIGTEPLYGVRVPPTEGTCGWLIWGGEYSEDLNFYDAVHVEHLPDLIPHAMKYLALAPGFRFVIDKDGYEDVYFEPAE
jgi:hypothetical protein